jgi:hypothetical protein
MSFIQNFFTSRDNNANAETYVGQQDRLWYSPNTNAIYVNSANVAGGTPVTLPATANLTINNLTANTATINNNLVVTGNISPAANNKIGGIAPGPGVEISDTGLLTIDSAGLPVSFGDFFANVNQLSMVNENEAMYLVSNGTGNINLIGGVNFFKPNGFPPVDEPFFRVKQDGQVQILVPAEDPIEGGVEIVGSASGNYIAPGSPGTMLQLTGNPGIPTRLYMDGNAEYASFVARRYNGNVAVPTQVLAGQDVLRINSTAATNLGGGNVGNVAMAQIRTTALENQTDTAQGSSITFTVTAIGSPANARVDVANVTVADGITATKFTTAGTVTATGNITGGNLNATGLSLSGNVVSAINTTSAITTTANIAGGNLTTAGITSTGSLTASTTISAIGNITGGNVSATNYTGLVTHSIRNAGAVGGTTLTLNVTTDDIVRCTFTTDFTVAFSNIVAGRVITLIATNTSGADTDVITSGVAALNTTSAGTFTVSPQTTAVITYYSLDGDTANIYASAVYA